MNNSNNTNGQVSEIIRSKSTALPGVKTSVESKKREIAHHFSKIMLVLGLDLDNPSLQDTPNRVAHMYVEEVFKGLNPGKFPKISLFDNPLEQREMILVRDIRLYSYCEHHFVPFFGQVHIAYLPKKKVIGLSKINRIVEYISSKPQIQERLTSELAEVLGRLLETRHLAIVVEATHLCVASRGIKDDRSRTKTQLFLGKFKKRKLRDAFLLSIGR
jgi:GTP cyclohydrolase I